MKENFVQWVLEGNITLPATLLNSYKEIGLNEEELVLLLHVFHYLEKGNEFPTPNEISSKMTVSVSKCTELLRKLIQQGYIEINDGHTSEGIRYEKYSLQPLWEKLVDQFLLSKRELVKEKEQREETDIYTTFEQEFGRPLSPFECETLGMWLDDDRHEPIIIKAALREAVISGKLNFRYIDRILFEWKKNGIKTIEQAKSYGKKFRQYQSNNQRQKKEESGAQASTVQFYNWLE
jgi:DNA replication protein